MIYIIITSVIIAHICNKQLYKICDEINKNKINTIIIYLASISSMMLIYYKYELNVESIKYLSLIPFIIIISIIDYHTIYIYNMTVLSGIIVQGVIFLITINRETDALSHILGLVIGFMIPYILSVVTKGLGKGDIGLYGLCCFALGHNYVTYLIYLSYVMGFIYCMYILLLKRYKIRKIPFAPFISLATITIMLTNYDILKIYFDIISN